MTLIFMGNPDFSVKTLDALCNSNIFDKIYTVTSPDAPKGRGYKTVFPELKKYALEHDIPCYQPIDLKADNFKSILEDIDPDIIIVASCGMFLPEYVLNYPKYGCICVHASLLPEYRGAAPINRAIMDGKKETGITIMKMDKGIDTGDMISKVTVSIEEDDNYTSLHDKLAIAGSELLVSTLPDIFSGSAKYEKQDDSMHTYAKKITEEDRRIDWSESAHSINCRIRGLSPEPCAIAESEDGKVFKLFSASVIEGSHDQIPGTVIEAKRNVKVACGNNSVLLLKELQPAGGKRMLATDAANGRKITIDTRFI